MGDHSDRGEVGTRSSGYCVYKMLLVGLRLIVLGLVGALRAVEDTPLCQILGSPEIPLLSKEGDVTIGGAFSIHSKVTEPPLSFTDTPTRLTCSRYGVFLGQLLKFVKHSSFGYIAC